MAVAEAVVVAVMALVLVVAVAERVPLQRWQNSRGGGWKLVLAERG